MCEVRDVRDTCELLSRFDLLSSGLGPRAHASGYFRKRRFFPPYLKKSASTRTVLKSYLQVHACTQKRLYYARLHLLSMRRLWPSALDPNFDVIVFENLRFPLSTVWRKRRLRVDGRCKRRKKSPFSNISGYVWRGLT